jgi:hypothetical protein
MTAHLHGADWDKIFTGRPGYGSFFGGSWGYLPTAQSVICKGALFKSPPRYFRFFARNLSVFLTAFIRPALCPEFTGIAGADALGLPA